VTRHGLLFPAVGGIMGTWFEMESGPGGFDWLAIPWRTHGFMVLFSVMNKGNGIYPVFYAGWFGCIGPTAGA